MSGAATRGIAARRAALRWVVASIVAIASLEAAAQPACRVLDPEIAASYDGPCVDGLAEGEGHARGAAAEYRGGFVAGRKHGRGTKTWFETGDRYEGDFAADLRHGRGTYTWGARSPWAGERYEGDYREDRRQGQGTYIWASGDRYSGAWGDDLQLGLQTPMQQQRTRASKAALEAIGRVGAAVCGTTTIGIAERRAVRGEVIGVVQDRLLIRVTAVGDQPAASTVAFWDLVMNWRPCRDGVPKR